MPTTQRRRYLAVPNDLIVSHLDTDVLQDHEFVEELAKELSEHSGFIKLCCCDTGREGMSCWYNNNVCGLFFEKYLAKNWRGGHRTLFIRDPGCTPEEMSRWVINIGRYKAELMTESQLRTAFYENMDMEALCRQFGWGPLDQWYFAVKDSNRVPQIQIKGSDETWNGRSLEKANLVFMVDMTEYDFSSEMLPRPLFYQLLANGLQPIFSNTEVQQRFSSLYSLEQKSDERFYFQYKNEQIDKAEPVNDKLHQEIVKSLCDCDMVRARLPAHLPNILERAEYGHWDLWEPAQAPPHLRYRPDYTWVELGERILYARNPARDIANASETVAIDFGTSSTTVAIWGDNHTIVLKLIGEVPANITEITPESFENPTILACHDMRKFLGEYYAERDSGRPETRVDDIDVSYEAKGKFNSARGQVFRSLLPYPYKLKQWIYDKSNIAAIIDENHNDYPIKPAEGGWDPVEIYAYYLGLNINRMHDGKIYQQYLLSYPPTYPREACEEIRRSFEAGIRKSIPAELFQSGKMEHFSVRLGASEPTAYAVCALQQLGITSRGEGIVYCGIYDLGGGTLDFNFGYMEGERPPFFYKSIATGGDSLLGCENFLEELAFQLFWENRTSLTKENKTFRCARPPRGLETGQELIVSNSDQAKRNTLNLIDALRDEWIKGRGVKELILSLFAEGEKTADIKTVALNGDEDAGFDFVFNNIHEFFREKVAQGVSSFLAQLKKEAGKLPLAADETYIFLAGNASRAPIVTEVFREFLGEDKQIRLMPPLPRNNANGEDAVPLECLPSAKTGVVYGTLLSREGSPYVRVEDLDDQALFPFQYHIGVMEYDVSSREHFFVRKATAQTLTEDRANLEHGYRRIGCESGPIFTLLCSSNPRLINNPKVIMREAEAKEFRLETGVDLGVVTISCRIHGQSMSEIDILMTDQQGFDIHLYTVNCDTNQMERNVMSREKSLGKEFAYSIGIKSPNNELVIHASPNDLQQPCGIGVIHGSAFEFHYTDVPELQRGLVISVEQMPSQVIRVPFDTTTYMGQIVYVQATQENRSQVEILVGNERNETPYAVVNLQTGRIVLTNG